MSRGRTSTYRRFEERHPDLWDEVQAMIESEQSHGDEPAEAPSIFARLFRSADSHAPRRARRKRRPEEPSLNTAQQCRLLAVKARVKAAAVPAESESYLAIAREYEALAAALEAGQGGADAQQPLGAPNPRPKVVK